MIRLVTPTIINLFGGPGTGKSSTAAGVFYHMKKEDYNIELVTEYAKELVYDHRHNILSTDQLYILAKQHRKLLRMEGEVDYMVTDHPLLMQQIYLENLIGGIYNKKILGDLILDIYNNYNNLNIFLVRNPDIQYKYEGRLQDEEGAKKIDLRIEELIKGYGPYTRVEVDDNTVNKIVKMVEK